jgi:hypothetical protein
MVGDFTAAGEIGSGALLARAIEPAAGEHAGDGAGGLCLNCGTRRTGAFCQHCGQSGHTHRTMGAIGHDLLHSVLHFDGKTFRTLPLLFFRPGELTRRYIDGERARFVSPLAIFLFSVFLMFAVLGSLPGWNLAGSNLMKPGVASTLMRMRTELAEEKARARTDLVTLEKRIDKERVDPGNDPSRLTRLETRAAAARQTLADLAKAEALVPRRSAGVFGVEGTPEKTNSSWIDAKWRHAKENPELLLYKVKTSAYKYSWALIPISLPFIWLLFPLRRDVGMYDHAIFATYSLTFMSLLAIALATLGALGVPAWICVLAALLIPPVHLYKQLKGAYRLGRLGTLWRLFWLLNFTALTTGLFAAVLLYLGLG